MISREGRVSMFSPAEVIADRLSYTSTEGVPNGIIPIVGCLTFYCISALPYASIRYHSLGLVACY